ncbi:hypothetical protein TPHA_0B04550 [Tetrapisispora phaffii CBS 4417]|uniref:S-adenosyl-L-homocysteine hydrolase NAD binding domain-containing protein n=1 Tax=Tetrapisispora phaffii (strain ATCC 24235 / CBS 4417 / NBRC 1672 / NRRL Y-8282 / UCD 70-5) TaxID=1071381 RepID=G8BQ43_TETPH|nr:hypothetical protein TPHA_0B04550 [Tetrapisispora phaffii CBS 4417]CCE62124.1 hypothetical protein TPHA_0B04550 [Tetrapisispora phaffii CBS 4417]
MGKPVVLRLGCIRFGQQKWEEFSKTVDLIVLDDSMTRAEFLKLLQDPHSKLENVQIITRTFLSVNQTGRFDKEIAEALPASVKAIVHTGAGYDQVDVEHFNKRGIQVANVPDIVTSATADNHVFLLLGALRNFSSGHRELINGNWEKKGAGCSVTFGHDPVGKTVGVLGMGGIGRAVVSRLQPFGFEKFIYHNRNRLSPELEAGCQYVSFDELLKQADIISINVPLSKATRHIIDETAISKMKDGVVIVNTSRGAVIDEQALIRGLQSGKIRTAGLDVFEFEPKVPQELIDMPQVLSLPHMGTYCVETWQKMEEFVVENAINMIEEGKVISLVPEQKNEAWIKEL